jgi:hypothetical protein
MNIEKVKGDRYIHRYEGFFVKKKDALGKSYPKIKNKNKTWNGKFLFVKKLLKIQKTLNKRHEFTIVKLNNQCLLCDVSDIGDKQYELKKVHWNENIIHYILQHNYKPSTEFIEFILGHYVGILSNNNIRLPTLMYQSRNSSKTQKYAKIDKNQLQILDALMNNGGWMKKYEDVNGEMKYSEHSGVLLFNDTSLDKLIISSKSTTNTEKDDEIFLPTNMIEAYECEYIFHTHPPTPYPGGRINNGVLFELPSSSDIAHFIEHSVIGITRGSLVVTPEGLYNIKTENIRKNKYIFADEYSKQSFLKNIDMIEQQIQLKYIKKYNNNFYQITQKSDFLKPLNDFLQKYNVHIDYYPRIKNKTNMWILDDVYLPI